LSIILDDQLALIGLSAAATVG